TDIGRQDIIIGMAFLREHNPELDWNAGNIEFTRCPSTCTRHTVQDEELRSLQLP
ncbi:hypothetical protein DICSQDRAFT_74897, partial [Dichomitus squalens LYAD-421 SS1]